ncbi:hypothetical protein [Comamonas testosteroni]|uniref:hypothetical protein n=1 Tax=Comamonas testosteroni TaxID=285 RepID=UPI0026EAC615|nr:hypothetical protein [Comamonas testosteroni]
MSLGSAADLAAFPFGNPAGPEERSTLVLKVHGNESLPLNKLLVGIIKNTTVGLINSGKFFYIPNKLLFTNGFCWTQPTVAQLCVAQPKVAVAALKALCNTV